MSKDGTALHHAKHECEGEEAKPPGEGGIRSIPTPDEPLVVIVHPIEFDPSQPGWLPTERLTIEQVKERYGERLGGAILTDG